MRQVERERSRRRPLADDDVETIVLERRIEDLIDRMVEAVDLVDEEDVALVERGQDCGQVPCPLDRRAAGIANVRAELAGDDRGEGRLAEAGRAVQQDVICRVPSLAGGAEQDRQVGLELPLADVFVQGVRPKGPVDDDLGVVFGAGSEYPRDVSQEAARSLVQCTR